MATINEIKNLIKTKIEGQGSQVDIGNGLPSVLNGITDILQSVQKNINKGYVFRGCIGVETADDLPPVPSTNGETADGNYFIIVNNYNSGESPRWQVYVCGEGEDAWQEDGDPLYYYIDAEDIEASKHDYDGYITPRGLVNYVASCDVLVLPTDDYTDVYGSYPTKAAIAAQFGISESDVDGLLLGKYRIIKDNADHSIWSFQGSTQSGGGRQAVFVTWFQDEQKFIAIGYNNGTYNVVDNV